ncbi:MAG TPA: hypothetical protein VHE36_13465 [Sphingomicrobium sp.]|nr:hypothetical protein [Sphingomicrobium sp.]
MELAFAGFIEHQLPAAIPERDKKRWLYVTPEIDALLSGSGPSEAGFPSVFARDEINRFCRGWVWSVTSQRNKKVTADLKKMEGHDEAWVFVFPKPRPGWRLFRRFYSRDIFVGLVCKDRHECEPDAAYQQHAIEMIARWQQLIPGEPLRGRFFEDYLSDPTGTIIRNKDEHD